MAIESALAQGFIWLGQLMIDNAHSWAAYLLTVPLIATVGATIVGWFSHFAPFRDPIVLFWRKVVVPYALPWIVHRWQALTTPKDGK